MPANHQQTVISFCRKEKGDREGHPEGHQQPKLHLSSPASRQSFSLQFVSPDVGSRQTESKSGSSQTHMP